MNSSPRFLLATAVTSVSLAAMATTFAECSNWFPSTGRVNFQTIRCEDCVVDAYDFPETYGEDDCDDLACVAGHCPFDSGIEFVDDRTWWPCECTLPQGWSSWKRKTDAQGDPTLVECAFEHECNPDNCVMGSCWRPQAQQANVLACEDFEGDRDYDDCSST